MPTLTASPAMRARLVQGAPAAPIAPPAAELLWPAVPMRRPKYSEYTRNSFGGAPASSPEPIAVVSPDDAARARWQERCSALFLRLRQLSPALFAGPKPVPMAVGIHASIIEHLRLEDPQDLAALRVTLRDTTVRRAYQTALSAAGAMRHDLDGNPVEPVTDDHRAQAQAALEGLKRKARDKVRSA